MDSNNESLIISLFPGYFAETLPAESREKVKEWIKLSPENKKIYTDSLSVWESANELKKMQQFNSAEALKKINTRIYSRAKLTAIQVFQRVAAVILLPLLIYAGVLTYRYIPAPVSKLNEVSWKTVGTNPGIRSQVDLPDGTLVWLNSGSKLEYKSPFSGKLREVKLTGEAFFEVKPDKTKPFIVNTGTANVEVTGTSFNVANYEEEAKSEIILKSGSVHLFTGAYESKKDLCALKPGQRAVFDKKTNHIGVEDTDVDKYFMWKDGILCFADDPMDEVAIKLNRWFNTEIILADPELKEYIYKATFHDETLVQVLELLKLSAPINYSIDQRKPVGDGSFSKRKVYIYKRKE